MGLDMYLYKKMYVGNDYKKPTEQAKIKVKGVKQERVTEIVEKIGQWRKANQIHQWFVDNVQDGEDDCKEYYVYREQLHDLLVLVNRVLKSSKLIKGKINNGTKWENGVQTEIIEDGLVMENTAVAKELLPCTEGFFFGGTDYDEYYYQDLKDTKKILEEALKETEGDFYYRSSW